MNTYLKQNLEECEIILSVGFFFTIAANSMKYKVLGSVMKYLHCTDEFVIINQASLKNWIQSTPFKNSY